MVADTGDSKIMHCMIMEVVALDFLEEYTMVGDTHVLR